MALDVTLDGVLVGILGESSDGSMTFRYAGDWLRGPDPFPVSQSLPLTEQTFADGECRAFFGGLLPEGRVRETIERQLRVSPGNDFRLLSLIGDDCAGALKITPPARGDEPAGEASHRWLDEGDVARLLRGLPARPLGGSGGGTVRLSLAGAQDKLALSIDGDRIGLPLGGAPSTHLVKIPIPGLVESITNEAYCLRFAECLGADATNAQISSFDGQECLLIRRFDRRLNGSTLVRIHQEDFCQALGVPSSRKYESEGGPSIADCVALLRRSARSPAKAIGAFVDLVAINYLIGGCDAHGKNYSLLYDAAGPRISPAYDLVSTWVYPDLVRKLAMRIGTESRPQYVARRHWDRLASDADLGPAALRRQVVEVARRAPAAADAAVLGLDLQRPAQSAIVERIRTTIVRHADRLIKELE
jgi:serine/threonine-protein kinase HipA